MQFDYPDFENDSLEQLEASLNAGGNEALRRALALSREAYVKEPSDLPSGMAVVCILRQLDVDDTVCIGALLSDQRLSQLSEQQIREEFGDSIADIVKGVRWMHSFTAGEALRNGVSEQAEQIRRLIMQAVSDVRAILVKLAFRVERLRKLSSDTQQVQKRVAQNTLDVFAPMANRLGIGQLKWELEDLSFRYLEPDAYKSIASHLEEKRPDREAFISNFVQEFDALLQGAGIEAEVSGRPKHIYSIAKKMHKKTLDFGDLYDVRAVRVIVDELAACYGVLGLAHNHWRYLPAEFDDYIARPKENGYQSLHTVVFAQDDKPVEIQIRTRRMHELAESGVAAHWRYKEHAQGEDEQLEHNLAALRQLLEADSLDEELLQQFKSKATSQRVFVFTPSGEVLDLRAGSTPVDFAYSIHTEVGHRCQGAKVNGRIVPLSYQLQDADTVEILTAREASPTREWMNPQAGYIHSPNIRAKVRAWFNKRDFEQNLIDGGYIFERELNRFHGRDIEDAAYAQHFGRDSVEAMLADIGRGAISTQQLLAAIQALKTPEAEPVVRRQRQRGNQADAIEVSGVGNLLTQRASCCQPIQGDAIIGFVTNGRGVSVHRADCANIKALELNNADRLIPVSWVEDAGGAQGMEVSLRLEAFDREGLLKDVSSVLSREHVYLNAVQTRSDRVAQTAFMDLSVELGSLEKLSLVIDKLLQIPNVYKVERNQGLPNNC